MKYHNHIKPRHAKSTASTPQGSRIPGRKDQVRNNAGGYVFKVDEQTQLDRFLILGTEGGTYYATERKLTKDAVRALDKYLEKNGVEVVNRIAEISKSGRAPKNDPAIFALAYACASDDVETRRAAVKAIEDVCRTGTHMFQFADAVQHFRGWGRALRDAVANHYVNSDLDSLIYEVIKYGQREGWSHRDLLRLSHPKTKDEARNALFKFLVKPENGCSDMTRLARLNAALRLKGVTDENEAVKLIEAFDLPREAVPTELLNSKKVWESLLDKMPITATIRNLGKMSAVGLIPTAFGGKHVDTIVSRLTNEEALKRGRVHPITILNALKVYNQGHGDRGGLSWTPNKKIVSALDDAFYLAFKTIEPTGKNIVLGLDVSGSMDGGQVAGCPALTPREGVAVMAMVTARAEKNTEFLAFSHSIVKCDIREQDTLTTVIEKMRRIPMGGTDCSLPMLHALKCGWKDVGAFIVYTDNETWCGSVHPVQALNNYRQRYNRDAKLAVVAMTATEFSIADPKDGGTMDFCGFDSAAPQIMADFIRN